MKKQASKNKLIDNKHVSTQQITDDVTESAAFYKYCSSGSKLHSQLMRKDFAQTEMISS